MYTLTKKEIAEEFEKAISKINAKAKAKKTTAFIENDWYTKILRNNDSFSIVFCVGYSLGDDPSTQRIYRKLLN